MTAIRSSRSVRAIALAVTTLACVLTLPAGLAQARAQRLNEEIQFAISPQPLATALVQFSKQARMQLVTSSIELGAQQTQGVTGRLPIRRALEVLLDRTGLAYSLVGENTVAITVPTNLESEAPEPTATAVQRTSGYRHLAEADAPKGTPSPTGDKEPLRPENRIVLEEIVVTGSHVRGTEPAGSNLIVIDRAAIDRSGYARIEDLLATLPQNFKGIGEESSQTGVGNANFGAEVQLRGLGPGTTLTLVDGQRQPSGGTLGAFVDIASIPTAAIERIEILTDGASAIYGSDAIGGVVNFILRKDYQGAESRIHLSTAEGEANETQLSQLFGSAWDSGHALLGYQYYERDELPADARAYSASNHDMRAFGGSDFRDLFGAYQSNPGTIIDPLTFTPAYAIPRSQDGTNLTVDELIPGANYADQASHTWVLPRQKLHGAFIGASQNMSEACELSVVGRYSRREMKMSTTGFQDVVAVPSTNPFYVNPFEAESPDLVFVAYDFTQDLGPLIQSGTTDTYTATLGVTGQLIDAWQLRLTGAYGREKNEWQWFNRASRARIAAALTETTVESALNVFGDGSHNSAAVLEGLRLTQLTEEGVSVTWSAAAIADGPVWQMPGGAARLALGADYRDERLDVNSSLSAYDTSNGRDISATFAELNLPLVGTDNARPGFRGLALSLAARHEDYSDFGTTFDPKFGLSWMPSLAFKVRGTWGTSFRAPPFYQANEALNPPFAFPSLLQDPQSQTGFATVLLRGGNNPDLKEETATVWTAGFDLTPTLIPDLRVAMTYFDIDYRSKIEAAGPTDTLLVLEDQWPTIVNRAPTQAEIDELCGADCAGVTIDAIIDQRLRNLAVVHVKGLDLDLNYSLRSDHGTWGFGLGGTRTFSYERAIAASAARNDVVDTVSNPLSLRLRGNVSWSLRGWTAGVILNYAGKYQNPAATPLSTVDSWLTVDLHFGYQVAPSEGWLANTGLSLSAVNLFNERPPFVNQANGYDGANSTLLGRLVSIQLVKGW